MARLELVEGLKGASGHVMLVALRRAVKRISARRSFHEDTRCACCGGPLDDHRDVICESCCPTGDYFELCARVQRISELAQQAMHA